jgi:WD40 repeat protein
MIILKVKFPLKNIVHNDDENEEYNTNILMRLPLIDNKFQNDTKISDMCWNSSGNILALSYYVANHLGPCSHSGYINILKFGNFSQSKSFKEKIQIETNSCVKCIDSHPKNPSLFVCSSYTGEISLIDLSNENGDYIKNVSHIDSYFHKDCVISVKWTKTEYEGNHVRYIDKINLYLKLF